MDHGGFRSLGPTAEELDGLLRIRDLHEFIEQAYRVILHRPPDLRGAGRHARRLRLLPFYSRRRFLEQLQRSEEYRLLLARRLDESGGREGGGADRGGFRIAGPTLEDLDALLRIQDLHGFIEQAYRVILHRPPDLRGAGRHARRLRLLPFYSRRRFLEQLQRSEEYRLLLARRLEERSYELDRERLALEQRRCEHWDHERRIQELCGRIEELLRQALDPLHPIPELHARLLDQYRQIFERQLAAQEQQARLLGPLGELPAQYAQHLEQLREVLEAASEHGLRLEQQVDAPPRPAPVGRRGTDLASIIEENSGVGLEMPRPETIERFIEEAYRLILRRPPEPIELIEDGELLRGAAGRIKGEFLRALAERHSASGRGDDASAVVPDTPAACRICGGKLAYKWSLKVLRGRYVAHYHECADCQALQVVNPTWLEEAYAAEDRPLEENPDVGRFSRNFSVYSWFAALHRAGLFGERPILLDFGGGYGLLAELLKSGGFEVWQADPHVPVPFLAADRSLHSLDEFPDGSFEAIFALEVLEHLADPLPVLQRLVRMLKPDGTLMVSTGIYRPGEHDRRWTYLATEWGQHITFWSREALAHAAEQVGLGSLGYFPGNDGFCILMSRLPAEALKARLDEAAERLRDPEHLGGIAAPWDLQNQGSVRPQSDPLVEPVASVKGPRSLRVERGAA
jgi:2-polyprenyl-3-methyl-5-hydroxy-6-metoxy-1,4-benzoquinol methylase